LRSGASVADLKKTHVAPAGRNPATAFIAEGTPLGKMTGGFMMVEVPNPLLINNQKSTIRNSLSAKRGIYVPPGEDGCH
jgi:hypothetical protein